MSADPGVGQPKHGGHSRSAALRAGTPPNTGLHPCAEHTCPHMYSRALMDTYTHTALVHSCRECGRQRPPGEVRGLCS